MITLFGGEEYTVPLGQAPDLSDYVRTTTLSNYTLKSSVQRLDGTGTFVALGGISASDSITTGNVQIADTTGSVMMRWTPSASRSVVQAIQNITDTTTQATITSNLTQNWTTTTNYNTSTNQLVCTVRGTDANDIKTIKIANADTIASDATVTDLGNKMKKLTGDNATERVVLGANTTVTTGTLISNGNGDELIYWPVDTDPGGAMYRIGTETGVHPIR